MVILSFSVISKGNPKNKVILLDDLILLNELHLLFLLYSSSLSILQRVNFINNRTFRNRFNYSCASSRWIKRIHKKTRAEKSFLNVSVICRADSFQNLKRTSYSHLALSSRFMFYVFFWRHTVYWYWFWVSAWCQR